MVLSFGEKRRAVRSLRAAVQAMRVQIHAACDQHGVSRDALTDVSLTLDRDDFERVEWALGYVKTWVVERDANDDDIPGSGHYVRLPARYQRADLARPHVLLKNCPVFYAE